MLAPHFVLKRLGKGADPESLRMLQRISDCGVRLDHLILDLLSYSAISREVLALAPVDLDKLVAEVVGQYPDIGKARVAAEAYRLGANSFVIKPSSAAELVEFASALKSYWLRFNEFAEAA